MSARAWTIAIAALVACGPAPPPRLTELDVDAPGMASGVRCAIDARGALLVAVSSVSEGHERVTVLEEVDGALVPRAWPGALDAVVDMPALATGPGGVAAVALRAGADGANGDVLVATRDAAGRWHEPARSEVLSFPPRAYQPRVAFDDDGALWLVANQGAAARIGYGAAVSHAPQAGEAFVRPRDADDVLSPPLFFSNSPRLALDAHGAGVVTWYQSLGGRLRVLFASRARGDAAFARADGSDVLSPDGGDVAGEAEPEPVTSPDGRTLVGWAEDDGRGGVAVYVARRASPSDVFERPRSLDDHLSIADGIARSVHTALAPDGTALVVWSERASAHEHVFLARIARDATLSDAEIEVVSCPERDADAPALTVTPEGGLAVAFVERTETDARLVLRRAAPGRALAEPEVVASGVTLAWPVLASAHGRLALGWIAEGRAHLAATRD